MADFDAFDALRQKLEQEAVQAATALSLKIVFDDDDFPKQTSTPFIHFWYETGDTSKPDLSGGRRGFEITPGLIHFNIYAPEKYASGPLVRYADQLKRRFNLQQYLIAPDGHLKLRSMSVQREPLTRKGFKITWARAVFDYWHRDAAADDFNT